MDAMREFATTLLATLTDTAIQAAPVLAAAHCGDPECQGHDQLVPPMVFIANGEQDSDEPTLAAQVFVRNFSGVQEMERAYGEIWAALAMLQPEVLLVANEVRKASAEVKALREAGIDIPQDEDAGAAKAVEVCAVHHIKGLEFEVARAIAEYHVGDDGNVTFSEPIIEDKLPKDMAPALAAMSAGVFAPPEMRDINTVAEMLQMMGHMVIVQATGEVEP